MAGKLIHAHLLLDFFTFFFLYPKSDLKGENVSTLHVFCPILSWNGVGQTLKNIRKENLPSFGCES
jgi:hypothetical protein